MSSPLLHARLHDLPKRLISFAANEKFESPAAGTSLGQAVGQWKSKYGLERVYAWHTIGGYWGGVSTLSPQFAHLLPAQVQPTPTSSLQSLFSLQKRPRHSTSSLQNLRLLLCS